MPVAIRDVDGPSTKLGDSMWVWDRKESKCRCSSYSLEQLGVLISHILRMKSQERSTTVEHLLCGTSCAVFAFQALS